MTRHRRRVDRYKPSVPYSYRVPEERLGMMGVRTSSEIITVDVLKAYMEQSMHAYFKNSIGSTIKSTDAKDHPEALKKLKEKLSTRGKQVPRGLWVLAITLAGGEPSAITRACLRYKVDRLATWLQYVESNFDKVASATFVMAAESSLVGKAATKPVQSEGLHMRACTVPISNIIREDLPIGVRDIFFQTLKDAIRNSSDHSAELGAVLMCTALALKDFSTGSQPANDTISKAIPAIFLDASKSDVGPFPAPTDVTSYDEYSLNDFNSLFTQEHFHFMSIANFSPTGHKISTVEKHPLWKKLQQHMLDSIDIRFEKNNMSSYIKALLGQQLAVNMKTMWSKRRLYNKSLDQLLSVLLRLHLMPKKELRRCQKMKLFADQHEQESDGAKAIGISRNKKWSIVKKEEGHLRKYQRKIVVGADDETHWRRKVDECQLRLKKFKGIPVRRKESTGNEDADEAELKAEDEDVDALKVDNDISCRRFKRIKGVLKNMLSKAAKIDIAEADILSIAKDLSDKEQQVAKTLYSIIRPYIPPETKEFTTIYQLLLVHLSNYILRSCRYGNLSVDICPLPKYSSFDSLRLDAHTIYSLFSGTTRLGFNIFKEDDSCIRDEKDAVWHKQASFGSFFDLAKINQVCRSYRLEFAFSMQIRPGAKTAVLYGERKLEKVKAGASTEKTNSSKKANGQTDKATPSQLSQEIELLESRIKLLNSQLYNAIKGGDVYDFDQKIKPLKGNGGSRKPKHSTSIFWT